MQEYDISLSWDGEASVWVAVNDAIPIALESGSLDALIVQVKYAVPELLEENGKLPESGEIHLRFLAERTERLDCNRYLRGKSAENPAK